MANILLVEDSQNYRETAKYYLENGGHKVITAEKLDRALQLVERLEELGVSVVLLDGNLTSGDNSGNDGRIISEKIRTISPNIKIIAWSRTRYDWGDHFLRKFLVADQEAKNALLHACES